MRWVFLLSTLGILTAALCSPSCTTRDPADVGKVTLKYTRWGDPAEMESTKELIDQFQRENPDILVTVDVVSWDQYWQKMTTAATTKTAQDVWLMSNSYVEEFAGAGHLLDLMPFVKADPTFKEDDYFPRAFDDFTFTGEGDGIQPTEFDLKPPPEPGKGKHLYAFTRDYNCVLLYYNKDHFDALGLPYPTADWTWDDLIATARKLTIDFDGDGHIDQWGYGGLNPEYFSGAIGGRLLDAKIHKSTYSTPEMVKSIALLQDMIYQYHVHPPPEIVVDETESFVTGKISMTVVGVWNMRSYNRAPFRWDIAPVPVDVKGRKRSSSPGGVAHCIYAGTPYPREAWKLVKFLSSDAGQLALARSGTSVPVLKRAAFSKDFMAPYDRPPKASYHVIFDAFAGTLVPNANSRGYQECSEGA